MLCGELSQAFQLRGLQGTMGKRGRNGRDVAAPAPVNPADLLHSAEPCKKFGSYERMCTAVLVNDAKKQKVLLMPNGLAIVMLCDDHPLLLAGQEVVAVESRQNVEISGKRKKGATAVAPDGILCIATTAAGDKFKLRCTIKGYLLELNDVLLTQPNLLMTEPDRAGFIAIIQPVSLQRYLAPGTTIQDPYESTKDAEAEADADNADGQDEAQASKRLGVESER